MFLDLTGSPVLENMHRIYGLILRRSWKGVRGLVP
jgi:hypothetical protein